MTTEEAISILGKCYYCEENIGGFCYATDGSCHESKEKAIEAMKKQIPMKPTKEFNCPRCGLDVLGDGHFVEYMQFCSNCGQAIDWSSEGE